MNVRKCIYGKVHFSKKLLHQILTYTKQYVSSDQWQCVLEKNSGYFAIWMTNDLINTKLTTINAVDYDDNSKLFIKLLKQRRRRDNKRKCSTDTNRHQVKWK